MVFDDDDQNPYVFICFVDDDDQNSYHELSRITKRKGMIPLIVLFTFILSWTLASQTKIYIFLKPVLRKSSKSSTTYEQTCVSEPLKHGKQ